MCAMNLDAIGPEHVNVFPTLAGVIAG